MDQRDQELLDKQLRQLSPSPRSDGVMILAMVAVLFAHESEPMQIASNDTTPSIFLPNGASSTARR